MNNANTHFLTTKKQDKLAHVEPVAMFLSEFCKRYCLSRSSFYREVKSGRLRVYKRGKLVMVESNEAERWFASINPPAVPNATVCEQAV